jgi:hypothetical protein
VPQWSEKAADAVFFDRVEEADARAQALGGRPIFAVVATKPIPRSHVDRCNEEEFLRRHRRRRHLVTSEIPV